MATLADSFLADLDELFDNETDLNEENVADASHIEEYVERELADLETLNYDDLDSVSKLQNTERYAEIMFRRPDRNISNTTPSLRPRACRLLAAKSTLAAQVDFIRGDPSGNTGIALREAILKKN